MHPLKAFQKMAPDVLKEPPVPIMIAGGAVTSMVTGNDINDWDIYLSCQEDASHFMEHLLDYNYWMTFLTKKAATFTSRPDKEGNTVKIQVCFGDFYESPDKIYESFDFTINMACLVYDETTKTWSLHQHADFMLDCASRTLNFNMGTKYPLVSLLRIKKYVDKGYTINRNNMIKMGVACASLKLNSWEDAADAIGGQYGEELTLNADTYGDFSMEKLQDVLNYSMVWKEVDQTYCPRYLIALMSGDELRHAGNNIYRFSDGKWTPDYDLLDWNDLKGVASKIGRVLNDETLDMREVMPTVFKVLKKGESGELTSYYRNYPYPEGVWVEPDKAPNKLFSYSQLDRAINLIRGEKDCEVWECDYEGYISSGNGIVETKKLKLLRRVI